MTKQLLLACAVATFSMYVIADQPQINPDGPVVAAPGEDADRAEEERLRKLWETPITFPKGLCIGWMPGKGQKPADAARARNEAHFRRDYGNPSGAIHAGCEIMEDSKQCATWLAKKGKIETVAAEPLPGIFVKECSTCPKKTVTKKTEMKKEHFYSKEKPVETTVVEYAKVCQYSDPTKIN